MDNSLACPQNAMDTESLHGCVFDIQRFSVQDGPGIRTSVFFKGCPLSCLWCSNPESQKKSPEVLYRKNLCVQCYRCIDACPSTAIKTAGDGFLETNRTLCQGCGTCQSTCLNAARRISGKTMTVDEVMEIVLKDLDYYYNSGGGVTASGGEAGNQPEFLLEFFKQCQKHGLHTTLDTCGFMPSNTLEEILEYVDLVLYDIKAIDHKLHLELTGASNEIILKNARLIAAKNKPMIIRVPLIPQCTASEKNTRAIARFAGELGNIEVNLLPYHKFGQGKYESLDLKYPLGQLNPLDSEQVESIAQAMRSYGVTVNIIY